MPLNTAILAALIGATAAYYIQNHILPYQKRKEKANLALAEIANATRHFERSVENLESFVKNEKGRRLGRIIDYEKCKYSPTGFVGLSYSDLMGLPDKIGRDLMQIGMVYRNTSLEVDAVVLKISGPSMNDVDLEQNFFAIEMLINRLHSIIDMSKKLHHNLTEYTRNVRAISANREIDWPDEFYKQGNRCNATSSSSAKVDHQQKNS